VKVRVAKSMVCLESPKDADVTQIDWLDELLRQSSPSPSSISATALGFEGWATFQFATQALMQRYQNPRSTMQSLTTHTRNSLRATLKVDVSTAEWLDSTSCGHSRVSHVTPNGGALEKAACLQPNVSERAFDPQYFLGGP